MDRAAIIDAVRTKIDEVSSSKELLVDVGVEDKKPLDTMIESLLDSSGIEILRIAPLRLLTVTAAAASAVTLETMSDDSQAGRAKMPDDFLRLASFRMDGWKRSTTIAYNEDDKIVARQGNPYLKGGPYKPVVILKKINNTCYLEYYSVEKGRVHQLKELRYVAQAPAEGISNAQALEALEWLVAAKVLSIVKDAAAKTAMENVKNSFV